MLQPTPLEDGLMVAQIPTAPLVEVFSAIQGEGLNVGTRQIFIRFGGCDLRCSYCDSAHTWRAGSTCDIEIDPGQRNYETYPNPVSTQQLLDWVQRQNISYLHDSISLTGGEPLLHQEFLAEFLPRIKQVTNLPLYLETGGHQPEPLNIVIPYLDLIGMDIKLPSVSGEAHWDAHHAFLKIAASHSTELFCKLIISSQTDPADLIQAANLIAQVHEQIVCFLQPMTPLSAAQQNLAPTPNQVLSWQALMKQTLAHVRVVPQTHKMIDQK